MEDVLYLVGIGLVITIAGIDKFCETYGFRNTAGPIKFILPFGGVIGALVGLWVITS